MCLLVMADQPNEDVIKDWPWNQLRMIMDTAKHWEYQSKSTLFNVFHHSVNFVVHSEVNTRTMNSH